MLNYFQLQFKILNRKIIDFGIPLFIGYPLIILVFIIVSNYLFGSEFLKNIFNEADYTKLRILENSVSALPFIVFLIYKTEFISALALIIGIVILVVVRFRFNLNFTIPTPFGRNPYEFVVGFRKTFFIFPIAYFLCFKSISVGNLNLGLFTLILVTLICASYYTKPENEYYVWNFSLSPKEFLIEKTRICFIYFSVLSFTIFVALNSFFFTDIIIISSIYILCLIFLTSIILVKYSAYPNEMSFPEILLIIICVVFPPFILVIMPYLYSKSIKNLNPLLK